MDPSIALLTIFVLAVFTGYEVVSKVSSTLHTPLMSGANAIHGIILLGAVIVAGHADGAGELAIGLIAVVLATVNLVGGFVVTDRMLEMFGARRVPTSPAASPEQSASAAPSTASPEKSASATPSTASPEKSASADAAAPGGAE